MLGANLKLCIFMENSLAAGNPRSLILADGYMCLTINPIVYILKTL